MYAKLTETSAAYRAIVVKSDGAEIQLNPPSSYWGAGLLRSSWRLMSGR